MDKTINKAVIAGGFAALAIFVLAYLQQRGILAYG